MVMLHARCDAFLQQIDYNKAPKCNSVAFRSFLRFGLYCLSRRIRFLGNQYQNIKSWAAEFDRATPEQQKIILAKLIEKITVDRNYNIHIYFFVTQDEFRQSVSTVSTTVSEAARCEFAV